MLWSPLSLDYNIQKSDPTDADMSFKSEDQDIVSCPKPRAERWRFFNVGDQITKEFRLLVKLLLRWFRIWLVTVA